MTLTRRQTLSSIVAAAAAGTLPRDVMAQSGGKTLVIGIAADPTGFDPEAVENNTSGFVMAAVFDSLVRYKTGSTEVEPGLAERWDVAPDGMQYTFTLRQGVKFHDGSTFDADAVVWNLDKLIKRDAPNYDQAQATKGRPMWPRSPPIVRWTRRR